MRNGAVKTIPTERASFSGLSSSPTMVVVPTLGFSGEKVQAVSTSRFLAARMPPGKTLLQNLRERQNIPKL